MHDLDKALQALSAGFFSALHEKDEFFLKNMQSRNLAGDDIARYQFWEWPQGVGLFALARLWQERRDAKQLELLIIIDRETPVAFDALVKDG